MGFLRASIVCFLQRLSPGPKLRICLRILLGAVISLAIAATFLTSFRCKDPSNQWALGRIPVEGGMPEPDNHGLCYSGNRAISECADLYGAFTTAVEVGSTGTAAVGVDCGFSVGSNGCPRMHFAVGIFPTILRFY